MMPTLKPDGETVSSKVLEIARKCNEFYLGPFKSRECKALYFGSDQIGLVRKTVEDVIVNYPELFEVRSSSISILKVPDISAKMDEVLRDIKKRYPSLITLKGWRDENYEIKTNFSEKVPLLTMERSATCLFGLLQYGVDINGYVNDPEKGLCLWFQKRSKTKQTWPGLWDNFVSGGLSEGIGVFETAVKEAQEEANVPRTIAEKMKPAGCVTFFFESERGLFPQTEFVFDLELSPEFLPSVNDGEVDEFELLPVESALSRVLSPDMKTTSCPVTLDFLIRHGYINTNTEPNLPELVELLHIPLHNLYQKRDEDL